MTRTIVALYDDVAVARQVIEDLVEADFARNSISLITNDTHNQYGRYLKKHDSPKGEAVATAPSGFSAVIGVLNSILVQLNAMMIPGIGLAIAAGPIVAHLTGVNAGTASIIDALIKGGVPEDDAPYYAEGIRNGGTLVSFPASELSRTIMRRYTAINIHEHIHLWQHSWKGFGPGFAENVDSTRTAPPVVSEPPIDEDDTSKSVPAIVPATPDSAIPLTRARRPRSYWS